MKRTVRAQLVGVGRERPAYVDKAATPGIVYTKAEIIERQLRGEPVMYGEYYGSHVDEGGTHVVFPSKRRNRHAPDPSWTEVDGYVVVPLVNRGTLDAD